MEKLLKKILQWVAILAAIVIVLLAVGLSLTRWFLPHLTQYQPKIQTWASEVMHQPVRIGTMTAAWRGLEPEVRFQQVEVLDKTGTQVVLKLNELDVGIDLLKSLFHLRVMPGWIIASGAKLTLQQNPDNQITVNGLAAPQNNANAQTNMTGYIAWLLSQDKIYLQKINLTWIGKNNKTIHLKRLSLKLTRGFDSHQLVGAAVLDLPTRATPLRFVIKMPGNPTTKEAFQANLFLEAKSLPVADVLANYSPNFSVTDGLLDLKLWATWENQQFDRVQSRFAAEDIAVTTKALKGPNSFNNVAGEMTWQRGQTGWSLAGNNLHFSLNNEAWPETGFNFQFIPAINNQAATQTLQVNVLNVAAAKNLLLQTNFLSAAKQQALAQINPTGELKNVALTHVGGSQDWQQYTFKTMFNQLSWSPWHKIPGANNMSGTLTLTPNTGSLALNSQQAQLDFGSLFARKIDLANLTLAANWQKTAAGWQIFAKDFSAANPLITLNGDVNLTLPADQSSPNINLLMDFNLLNPTQAMQYLPVGIMSKNLVAWLENAIVASKAMPGKLVLTGPLKQFPFDKHEGKFIVTSQINDLTLHYRQDWPDIENINGEMEFNDSAMNINVTNGKIFGAQLGKTQAEIPNLREPVLTVQGFINGDLATGEQFIRQSPLQHTIGKKIAGLEMQGPMQLNLGLVIPFDEKPNKINGNLNIQNGDLKMPEWWQLEVKQLAGNLQFTEDSFAGNLQGQFFGQPLNVKITTLNPTAPNSITQFDLGAGQMSLQQIQQRFNLPQFQYLDGNLNYTAMLQFQSGAQGINSLTLNTDLQGINVKLPAPFGKTVTDKVPTNIQIQFSDKPQTQLLINYGKLASAALTLAKDAQGQPALYGGEISLGGKQASLQNQPGLIIDGSVSNFSWDIWKPYLLNAAPTGKTANQQKSLLKNVDITFGQFNALGLSLTNAEISLKPQPNVWLIGINNPMIIGQIWVPTNFPQGTLQGEFKRLYLPSFAQKSQSGFAPGDMPNLFFHAHDLRYGERAFSDVKIAGTVQGKNTFSIDKVIVKSADGQINAQGQWQGTAKSQQTSFSGKLTTTSMGNLLKDWNVTKSLVNAKGQMNFDLQWNGPPYNPDINTLGGKVNLQLNNGRIINLSSSTETELGLGRVLNLFSLQTLPRRLMGDFSDLTDSGFTFDVMKGDFNLQNGNGNTTNAYLDGSVAKVMMKGRIGFANKDYDVVLAVSPYVTGSLPAVATVVGTPLIGAITWVATKVLNPVVSQIMTYDYSVKGGWDNPVITKLNGAQNKNGAPNSKE